MSHGALYPTGYGHHASIERGRPIVGHFVPEGWEDLDRGICPCGEVVTWHRKRERWVPTRGLIVLILDPDKAQRLAAEDEDIARQLYAQEVIP